MKLEFYRLFYVCEILPFAREQNTDGSRLIEVLDANRIMLHGQREN
jgi:hypothetical protein